MGAGLWSFSRLPVDAYPDLSPPMVEMITQWPGHAAEEVERLITVPIEVEMNGLPRMTALRSISLYGLSDVRMTFEQGTDNYFARQRVFERLPDLSLPNGVAPSVAPLFSPSGLVYRYVLESPDRIADGAEDDRGLGGRTAIPLGARRGGRFGPRGRDDAVPGAARSGEARRRRPLGAGCGRGARCEQRQRRRRLLLAAADSSTTCAASAGSRRPEDIGNVVLAVHNGIPVLVKDVARVEIGHAPRLGQFGFNEQDDAVEGVILMRTGEQAQVVLKKVEEKTRELNASILPKDVKVHPYYDRSELIALTTRTVEGNLLRGIVLVAVVLIFFLYDFRSGLIVATTIPLALLFAFICLDLRHVPANLLSIGAIDFGILVDGAVVMVENIYRQLALRHGTQYSVGEVIVEAAAEVDRPIFYAVSVIVAGFLPIYVLSGPSGELFRPMADTMIFALVGSLVLTLTLLPVLCSWALRKGVRERRNVAFEAVKRAYAKGLDCLHSLARGRRRVASALILGASLLLIPGIGAEFMPHLDEGALWIRATMPYTISFEESAKISPQIREHPAILSRSDRRRLRARTPGRRDRPDRFLQLRVLRRVEALLGVEGPYRTKPELIAAIDRKLQAFPGIIFNYTQPAEDAVDEAETGLKSSLAVKVFGPDLAVLESKGKEIKRTLERVRGIKEVTLVEELGQPSLTVTADRAKIARYGVNVADLNGVIEAAVGGGAATQVVQGEKLFDLVVRLRAAVPRDTRGDRQHPDRDSGRPAGPDQGARRHPARQRRLLHLPRRQLALHRRPVLGRGPGPRGRGGGRPAQVAAKVRLPDRIPGRLGRRVQGVHGLAGAAALHSSPDPVPDLPAALRALQQLQVSRSSRWPACSSRLPSGVCSPCA